MSVIVEMRQNRGKYLEQNADAFGTLVLSAVTMHCQGWRIGQPRLDLGR
jgi:hypothetical protein